MQCKKCNNPIPDGSIFCNWCGERQMRQRKKKTEISVPKPRQLGSGKWFIQLRINGQSMSVTADTEAMCRAEARAIKAGLLEQKKKKAGITLSEAIDKYIDSRRGTVSPATIQTYQKKKRLYFQSLMKTDIASITISQLEAEVRKMLVEPGDKGKPLSPKTIKDVYSFIASVLKHHKISLPFDDISLPQIQASPFRVLTQEEITKLINALPGNPCELQILLALWLGLRRSEIVALEKRDFDFEHKTVTISRALVKGENNEVVEKGTKTSLSARVIYCPDYILDLVEKLPDGKLYGYELNYILKCLHRVCEQNKLPPVRLHDLRHINASIGLMLGIPDKYVMERNGWAQKDTMVYRYEHTYSAEKKEADKTYNDFFTKCLNVQIANKNANT